MRGRGVRAESPNRWRILPPRSEARLARLAAAGDRRAFARIYERYHEEIYRFCRALLGDPHEAQDALQSTMASALASLPGDGRTIALRPWLYRVARNECVSILRRRQQPVDPRLLEAWPAPDVAEDAARRARLGELLRDLRALGERQRAALLMRELGGLGYAEIAAALGISRQAARQAVYEARTSLLEMGEGRGMECERVRRALSERDGRRLRSRRLRAHLRACASCAEFEAALRRRPEDLAALFPLPPGLGAVALSGSLVAGKAAGGGAGTLGVGAAGSLGGASVASLGAGSGAKLAATVAAAGALGFGVVGIERAAEKPADESRRGTAAAARTGEPRDEGNARGSFGRRAHGAGTGGARGPRRPRGPQASGRDAKRSGERSDERGRRGVSVTTPSRAPGNGWRGKGGSGSARPGNGGGPPGAHPGRGPAGAPGLAVARGKPATTSGRSRAVQRNERGLQAPQGPPAESPAAPASEQALDKGRHQPAGEVADRP